nr:FAD-dependent monooxygenase [Celeribacter indicus]
MPKKPKILISGAGIGGLTAALSLLRRGFPVEVYEQAPVLGEVGAGLQIAPDGSRILIELGLEDAMEAVVCEADSKEVRLWNTGERRKLFDLGADSRERFGAPYWFVHRGDLHRVLLDAVLEADPDCVHPGRKCISYSDDGQHVSLQFEDGSTATGDAVICADGVHSILRGQAFASPKPEFTGMMSWRGIARMEDLPEDLRTHAGTNWVGPGGHVVSYALRRGELMNFAGIVERPDWTTESWSTKGTHEECLADFAGWNSSIHDLIRAVDQPFKWALVSRKPLSNWCKGRLTLLGDAAHPTLPFLAHGSIMALEDGYIVARCLDTTPEDPELAFRRFVATRIDRCTAIVDGSAENAKRFHNPLLADHDRAIRYLDEQWAPERVRQRYDWLFEFDAITVPLAESRETA